jgi:hypothetical protein
MAGFLTDDVQTTLSAVALAAADARDPWWLIGSAAMALHGALIPDIADVDLLMSPQDAQRLCATRGVIPILDGGGERFRSEVYAHWRGNPLPVDVMGGFSVHAEGRWQAVQPRTREAIGLEDGGVVHVPAIGELIEICRLFGRPKDIERARLLQALLD